MTGAYILINIDAGKAKKVVAALRKISGVKQAHIVTGLHDAVAYIEAPTLPQLINTIISKIQGTVGVNKTVTCIAVDGPK